MSRPPRAAARAACAAALATALALSLSACSGDDEPDEPDADGSPAASQAPAPLETTARIGEVTGRLDEERRASLTAAVTEVVDGWLDAAYVGGDFPRTDFTDAYPGFTTGAAAEAAKDAALTSNQGIGAKVEEVVATKREVIIDALAVKDQPAGVTARILLAMRLTGEEELVDRVRGRVFLTHRDGEWKIFGYDLQREGAR